MTRPVHSEAAGAPVLVSEVYPQGEAWALPKLEHWQFQPEPDNPGLWLLCSNMAQRNLIMAALGYEPACPSVNGRAG